MDDIDEIATCCCVGNGKGTDLAHALLEKIPLL